jgi:hypothetical protein
MTTPAGSDPQAVATRRAAWIGGICVVIAALIGVMGTLLTQHITSNGSPASGGQVTLGPFSPPNGNSDVGQVLNNLNGSVSNLKNGQLVWVFNEPLKDNKSHDIYPNVGPCPVSRGTWTCNPIYIGSGPLPNNPKNGQGPYKIWVAVVSEQDAYDIVNHLLCHPTRKYPCSQTYTTLPGGDIVAPQSISVDRTHS